MVKIHLQCRRTQFNSWVGKIHWRRDRLPTPVLFDFPGGSVVKNPPAMREIQVQSLGREDSPGDGNGNPLQCSCLENSMDRGTWRATVHGVAMSQAQLSNYHLTFTCTLWLFPGTSHEAWALWEALWLTGPSFGMVPLPHNSMMDSYYWYNSIV